MFWEFTSLKCIMFGNLDETFFRFKNRKKSLYPVTIVFKLLLQHTSAHMIPSIELTRLLGVIHKIEYSSK